MTSTHILLGALNKLTREYVYPKIANKKDNYVCIDCNKDLILCQGGIRVHHFRHHIDTTDPCNYYSSPSESQIHKDAKMLIKSLLERKIPLSFLRSCASCKTVEEFEIPEITDTSSIILEYRFQYDGLKIADVAYLDNNELLCIFEICNTHKTCSENRPEPWFEIDATQMINTVNGSENHYKIHCIRCEKCDECIETEKIKRINEIKSRNSFSAQPLFDDDTSGDFQMMRYMKRQSNCHNTLSTLTYLINEGIKYTEGNNVVSIVHPKSKMSIRRSTVSSKTFINGKWINTDLNNIVEWYKSTDGFIILCNSCSGGICKKIDNYTICGKCRERKKL